MNDWGKWLGLGALGFGLLGIAALALLSDEEPATEDGIPVTQDPPDDITDTDDEDDDDE